MFQELNRSQKEALDLSRHIGLTAVAGSGKTTVLVERFVKILASNGFRPEQIVAITFTEEAASEVKRRIRETIRARGSQKPRTERLIESTISPGHLWTQTLQKLSLAKVTTIHGFCLSLLREYALFLNLNPDFRVPPPPQQESMLWDSVHESVRLLASSASDPLAKALEYMTPSKITGTLVEMLRKREILRDAFTPTTGLDRLTEEYETETAAFLSNRPEFARLKKTLFGLAPMLVLGDDSCSRRCRRQLDLFSRRTTLDHKSFLGEFARTLEGRINPTRPWKAEPAYGELKAHWNGLRTLFRQYPLRPAEASRDQDAHFQAAMESLAKIYKYTKDLYQATKRQGGVLDFDDLLENARRLVLVPQVREAIQERYRFYLVDEFQDTSSIQWEILEPLIGPKTNLFIVGDAKQSIYRFRDADVSLFGFVRQWISSRGRCVDMPQNYRSLPRLVEFNNRLFQQLFRGQLPYDAPAQDMEACRTGSTNEEGAIELLVYPAETTETTDPELTAARIRRLIEKEGCPPRDIAVLLRARTRLKEYEARFDQCGIPFETMGGLGFFDRQEVLDLINLFRLFLNPEDSLALIGVLRSPFFSFSDEDIFEISRVEGENFRAKLREAAMNRGRTDREHWRFADSKLQEWTHVDRHYSLSDRLRKAFHETGYLSILQSSVRRSQLVANTEKLHEFVRNFEMEGRRSIREFVRFADTLIRSEVSEAESVPSEIHGDAVRIYTIHGAKGLQFPTVVVPELGAPFSSRPTDRFYCERLSSGGTTPVTFFATTIWNPDEGYSDLAHPCYEMLRRLDHYRQIAEEKRLLYVALTRARDRLILVGKNTQAPSYRRWLRESGVPVDLDSYRQLSLNEDVKRAPGRPPVPDTPSVPSPPGPPTQIPRLQWTPTEISLFRNCPRKYYLTQFQTPSGSIRERLIGDRNATIGSAVHEILKRFQGIEQPDLARELVHWEKHLRPFCTRDTPEIIDEIRGHIERVLASPFYERIRQSAKRFAERDFTVKSGDIKVRGNVDCLFEDSDGRWVVVDFKTSRVKADEVLPTSSREGYDLQLEFYLWATARILRTSRIEGFLFFTRTGDLLRIEYGPFLAAKCEEILRRLPGSLDLTEYPTTDDLTRCEQCPFPKQGFCQGGGPRQRSLFS